MLALLKKEFSLCLHPTCLLFLCFAVFVFIPNYPYEVMFFFSGLSVFFVCLTARENGDAVFTLSLPVRRRDAALARILLCVILQVALLVLAGVMTAVKEVCLSAEMQINLAGNCANLAFIGYGALLLGTFNLIFFPLYYKNPVKVGIPFLVASTAVFVLIGLLTACRFAVPFFATLNAPDPVYMGVKAAVCGGGIVLYAGMTAFSVVLSVKRFAAADI